MPGSLDYRRGDARRDDTAQDLKPRALCDHIGDAFVRVAMDGRILECNDLYCRLLGYPAEELCTLTDKDLTPARWHTLEAAIVRDQVLPRGRSEVYEKEYRRKDGRAIPVELRTVLERDAAGHPIAMWAIVRDIGERKRAEAALRESEERLRLVWRATRETIWDWDIENDRQRWSEAGAAAFGWTDAVDAPQTAAWWTERVHGEDRERVAEGFQRALEDPACERWQDEYRFLRRDGSVADVLDRGFILRDALGKPKRMVGAMQDITERRRIDEALRQSESRFRQVAEGVPQLIWTCAADGRCDYLSPQWLRYTGRCEAEQLGYGWLEQLHPEDRARTVNRWQASASAGQRFKIEFRIRRHDGAYRWFRTLAVPLRDAAGQVVRWFGSNTDIDDLKRAEAALRQSEAKYRSLFESIDEGFCIIEMIFDEQDKPVDYRFLEVNPAFEAQTGLSDAEGKRMRELAPQHEAHWFETYGRIALTGEAVRFQNRAAQLHRWYDVYAWRYGESQARQVAVLFNDITSRRQAEETLRQSERRLRMALDAAYTIAFEWDIPRNEVRRRLSHVAALPETPQERPSSLEEVCTAVHPEDRERFLANVHAALADPERGYRGEYRLCEPDGRILWLSEHGYLECDEQGQPQRLVGLSQDITQRKTAEDALRASEVRYRSLVKASSAITWTCPPSGLQDAPQPEWMAFSGQTAEQMLGTGWAETIHPEDVARVGQRWQDAVAQGVPFVSEHRMRRHDGEWRWMSVHAAPIRDARGKLLEWVGMNLDITERKRAEAAAVAGEQKARLRLSELEDLYRNAPVGLCLLDRELRFLRINERLAEINGIPAAEHIGRTLRELMPALADAIEALQCEVLETGQPRLDVEVVTDTPARPGVERSFLEQWLPVKDAEGRVTGISIVVEETTERRQAEQALQAANRRKDLFLATLAHELRNPLAPIRTGLDLLHALRGDAAACAEPLRIMDRQLSHLVHLVDDLLDLSRISRGAIELRKERLDLAQIIDAALDMSESGLSRQDRRLTVSVPPTPLLVEGDRVRLVQVVSNLLNNAAKFTDAGGHIALRVVPQGDRVEIQVQDDGRGIPPERLAEIFEPLARTDPGRGGGLGIGLSIVRSLVAMHGGSICAESDGPGRGTTFTVSLPLCRSAPEAQSMGRKATETAPFLPPQRRVLVVDDNRDIAEGLRLLLTTLKAEVRVAHDGAEAVRICADWQPTHVLMDLGMPGMDGYEAARRLRANHPDHAFRLVAVTGWGQDEDRQRTREAGFDEHLVKPVGVAELKAVLSS